MPVVTYEGPKLDQGQREKIIEGFTEVACKVMPYFPKDVFYVFIRDHPDKKIGVGGLSLPDYLKQLQEQPKQ